MDKGSKRIVISHEVKNFRAKWLFFLELSLFQLTWPFEAARQALSLNILQTGRFCWLFLMNFVDKNGTTKVYIPIHPCSSNSQRTKSWWVSCNRLNRMQLKAYSNTRSTPIAIIVVHLKASSNFRSQLWLSLSPILERKERRIIIIWADLKIWSHKRNWLQTMGRVNWP